MDLALKSNLKPDINAAIWLITSELYSYLILLKIHALDGFADEMMVLLTDNWSTHITSDPPGLSHWTVDHFLN
jgi:hypothetical protein